MKLKRTGRMPKQVARAETFNAAKHIKSEGEFEIIKTPTSADIQASKVRMVTNLAGAHPFIFDALSYVCTHRPDKVEIPQGDWGHYRITIPVEKFYEFALGGYDSELIKNTLKREIYDLAKNPVAKMIPTGINKKSGNLTVVTTQPIMIGLKHENQSESQKLKNLNRELRLTHIYISFFQPLFETLMKPEQGMGWFPHPAAFHAKLIDTMERAKSLPVFETLAVGREETPEGMKWDFAINPLSIRKLWLVMNLQNNKSGTFRLNVRDILASCYPGAIQDTANGQKMNWKKAKHYIELALQLFYEMGKAGHLDGADFIPVKAEFNSDIEEYIVKVVNSRDKLPENQLLLPFAPELSRHRKQGTRRENG